MLRRYTIGLILVLLLSCNISNKQPLKPKVDTVLIDTIIVPDGTDEIDYGTLAYDTIIKLDTVDLLTRKEEKQLRKQEKKDSKLDRKIEKKESKAEIKIEKREEKHENKIETIEVKQEGSLQKQVIKADTKVKKQEIQIKKKEQKFKLGIIKIFKFSIFFGFLFFILVIVYRILKRLKLI